MRTTVDLAEDTLAEVRRLRESERVGLSEAVNRLIRRGASRPADPVPVYEHTSTDLGLRIDVRNIGDVLDLLEADGSAR